MENIMKKLSKIKWYWYIVMPVMAFAITMPVVYTYNKNIEKKEENLIEEEVTRNVEDYLASYVATDGFVKTLVADTSLQEQLVEKWNDQTARLSKEQIDEIVDIAIENFRMVSKVSIEDLTEEQIEALEKNIYANIEGLLTEQHEDVDIVANGVTAIVEKNIIKQLEKMDASIGELQKEIVTIKSNILGSKDLEQLNLSLASMVQDIDNVNDRISEVKTVMNNEDAKLNQDLNTVNSELGDLQVYCDETATVLIKIRAYMDEMNNSSVLSLSQEMQEMYDVLNSAADAIEKLNSKILVIENAVKDVDSKTDTSSVKAELDKLKINATNMTNNINELKKNVEDNKSKTDKLISELKADDITILNKIETLNKTFTTLQNEAKEAINKLTTQMKTLQTTTNNAMTEIEAIKTEIEKIKREKLAVIDVVNSLTVNDSSKALSAAMGYQLELEIQALQGNINNITNGEIDGSLQKQINELQRQVQECFQYVSEGKSGLASALADKGISIDASSSFADFTTGIQQIGNLGTATPATILTGYTAYIQNQYVEGEMPYCGDINVILSAGESVGIPIGYHSGGGRVTSKDLASQTPATATADNISTGKTAWVNGNLVTGNGKENNFYYEKGKAEADQYNIKKIILTDDASNWWSPTGDGYEVFDRNSTTYNLGIYNEVYVCVESITAVKIGDASVENPTWRDSMNASYDVSTGQITVDYGKVLYLGGGNACKMTILYK